MTRAEGPGAGAARGGALRRALGDPRLRVLLVLGLAAGIPFDLRGQTLQLRLSEAKVDVTAIGVFSLVGLPYMLKFLWAPFLDRFTPPGLSGLGRRRGWQVAALAAIALGLGLMALASPRDDLIMLGLAALSVAFFSATFDIVVDAYRTDLLDVSERSFGAGLASAAYRMGMLMGGLATPWLAAFTDWTTAYLVMAAWMVPAILMTLRAPREVVLQPPRTLRDAVVLPLAALMKQRGMLAFMALILLYKLGDAFGSNLFSTFLYDGLGFSSTEIATTRKVVGSLTTVAGMVVGGLTIARYGLWRSLAVFGVLQAATNLVFVAQAADAPEALPLYLGMGQDSVAAGLAAAHTHIAFASATAGRDFILMFAGIGAENLAGGLGAAAFVTFITTLCDKRFSAFQYALLASIAMVGTITLGPIAGITSKGLGWQAYFIVSVLVAVPGLVLLAALRKPITALDRPVQDGAAS